MSAAKPRIGISLPPFTSTIRGLYQWVESLEVRAYAIQDFKGHRVGGADPDGAGSVGAMSVSSQSGGELPPYNPDSSGLNDGDDVASLIGLTSGMEVCENIIALNDSTTRTYRLRPLKGWWLGTYPSSYLVRTVLSPAGVSLDSLGLQFVAEETTRRSLVTTRLFTFSYSRWQVDITRASSYDLNNILQSCLLSPTIREDSIR